MFRMNETVCRFFMAALLLCGVTRASAGIIMPSQQPASNIVQQLIAQLGDNSYQARESAQSLLLVLLGANELTPGDLGLIRLAALNNPDPEIRWRAGVILSQWAAGVPGVEALKASIALRLGPVVPGFNLGGYSFGPFTGVTAPRNNSIAGLIMKYEAVRNDVDKGYLTELPTSLTALLNYVKGLTPAQFNQLGLMKGLLVFATQAEVVASVQTAVNQANAIIQQMGQGTGNANPGPELRASALAPGPVALGTSFLLSVSAVPSGGALDVFDATLVDGLYNPPPGYEFVGHVYDLLAVDSLEVSGAVTIGIVYGPGELIGNLPIDPTQLQLARLADGQIDLLPILNNNLDSFTITGDYVPPPSSSGLDQFGEFVLLQSVPPVPEPSSCLLFGMATLVAAFLRRAAKCSAALPAGPAG